jgi:hypothetical protein
MAEAYLVEVDDIWIRKGGGDRKVGKRREGERGGREGERKKTTD